MYKKHQKKDCETSNVTRCGDFLFNT